MSAAMQMGVDSERDGLADHRGHKTASASGTSPDSQPSGEDEYTAATYAARQAKDFQAPEMECLGKVGAPTIVVEATSANGTASTRGLQRRRPVEKRLLGLQEDWVKKRTRLEKVGGPDNAAESKDRARDHEACDRDSQPVGSSQMEASEPATFGGEDPGKDQEDIEEEAVEWSSSVVKVAQGPGGGYVAWWPAERGGEEEATGDPHEGRRRAGRPRCDRSRSRRCGLPAVGGWHIKPMVERGVQRALRMSVRTTSTRHRASDVQVL